MNRMQKSALAVVFCVCLGMPAQAAEPVVAGCPAGMVCVTKADADAIVRNFNEMAQMLDQAATMIEEQEKELADLRAKKACT